MATAVGERRGRSPERVYVTPVADWLHCAVCIDILSAPVSLPACGHTYCRACAASVLAKPAAQRKCPTCRKDISLGVVASALPLNWIAKAQIDVLRVHCRFGVKEEGGGWVADVVGCPAELTLDGTAAHEAACDFATTTCPFAGCGAELRRADVASHNAASGCKPTSTGSGPRAWFWKPLFVLVSLRLKLDFRRLKNTFLELELLLRCHPIQRFQLDHPRRVTPSRQLYKRMTTTMVTVCQSGVARSALTAEWFVWDLKLALSSCSMLVLHWEDWVSTTSTLDQSALQKQSQTASEQCRVFCHRR